jgi:hypothetical protein
MGHDRSSSGDFTWGRAIRVFLCLLVGLVAVDLAVAWHRPLWRAYDPDEYGNRLEVCRGRAFELVAVGGSTVAEGLDTRLLTGLRRHGRRMHQAYNLGLIGGTTTEVWHGVANGITAPPRLLIYGLTATDLNDSRDEPHGARSLMNLGDVIKCSWRRPRRVLWFARHFALEHVDRLWQLWRYRNGIRLWAADQVHRACPALFADVAAEARRNLERSDALAQEHGFAPNPVSQNRCFAEVGPAGRARHGFPYLQDFQVGEHLGYLHRLLNWGREHGVEVVLVDMPVTAEVEGRYPREFAVYRDLLAATARERGVTVLWARREAIGLSDADFGDMIHLNAAGARKLSRWLRHQLDDRRART